MCLLWAIFLINTRGNVHQVCCAICSKVEGKEKKKCFSSITCLSMQVGVKLRLQVQGLKLFFYFNKITCMHTMRRFLLLMSTLPLWALLQLKFLRKGCKNISSLLPSITMFIGQLVTYFKGLNFFFLLFKFRHTPKNIGVI